jgi:DNA repair and recombination RAD54-like protein
MVRKNGGAPPKPIKQFVRPQNDENTENSSSSGNRPTIRSKGMTLMVQRTAFMPGLSIPDSLARPYKSPFADEVSEEGKRLRKIMTLGPRRMTSSICMSKFKVPQLEVDFEEDQSDVAVGEGGPAKEAEKPFEPLVLWESDDGSHKIEVEPILCRVLREHQREGLKFIFDCVMGLKDGDCGQGTILADDMGLGKTLQTLALMWTLLRQGVQPGVPTAKHVIVVCPTSLVKNWDNEVKKWLPNTGVMTYPVAGDAGKEAVVQKIKNFLRWSKGKAVLIISYETFRNYHERFKSASACDLLVCDEAHRLKNGQALATIALNSLPCRRRVLLSGTPMQVIRFHASKALLPSLLLPPF